MAIQYRETNLFNYSPSKYFQKFNNLVYVDKDWIFKATLTKRGKKTINFFYSRKMNQWTESGTGGKKARKKVISPSKSILFIMKLIRFSQKQGYKVRATLTGEYKPEHILDIPSHKIKHPEYLGY